MEVLQNLASGFYELLTLTNLISCSIGVIIGTLIGVLPGIGPVATISILLPFTFTLKPVTAIIVLCGIYYGAQYGGSTTSILTNIPGEIGSIVTCIDGYQMALQGKAGSALGVCAIGSFIGGTLSVVGLMLLVPPLAKIALNFGPPELFALILFGLLMVTSLGSYSLLKGLIMAAMGMFTACIGRDVFSGFHRFTLGTLVLSDGVGLVPVAMGMYGIGELLIDLEKVVKREILETNTRDLYAWKEWFACRWAILRGMLIGFFLGIIPGAGVTMTTFFAYWFERRVSKHPEKFGTGMIEGVASPETANNAACAGNMIPLITFGIPANPTMALLLSAFIIQGIQPGPYFIKEHPQLFWSVIASFYIGNIMLLILNLPLISVWVKILKIPFNLLFPLIILFCFVGVYSLNNNPWEIFVMILFGFFAYMLRKMDYPLTPFLLAMVLGPMFETSFRQSMAISHGRLAIFFQRPISAFLMILFFMVLAGSLILSMRKKAILRPILEDEN